MSRMVIDDEMWSRLEPLPPKPKGRVSATYGSNMLDASYWCCIEMVFAEQRRYSKNATL